MDRKIHMSENHKRSLSSSLIVVEKSLMELEDMMQRKSNSCCNVMSVDIDAEAITANISVIQEAKSYICRMAEKYGTSKEKLSLQRIINAKRTRIWETLTDTLSGKVKGYGTIPKKYAEEYDSDIKGLLEIINKINS